MPVRLFLRPIALVPALLGVSALTAAPAALAGPLVATATDCPSGETIGELTAGSGVSFLTWPEPDFSS